MRVIKKPSLSEGEFRLQSFPLFKGITKSEFSWVLYDWANQSYVMIVSAVVFSLYFMSVATAALEGQVANPAAEANAYLGFANAAGTLIIGLMAPVIGTLSGYKGKKKFLFNVFAWIGILGTAGLAFVPRQTWFGLLVMFMIASIGFSGSNKIFDAFLVDISEDAKMNRVSSLSFAMGYIGGAIAFIFAIVLILLSEFGILGISVYTAYRISFFWAALWWVFFSIPMWKNVHQKYGSEPEKHYIKQSFIRIWTTLKEIRATKGVLTFLIAFFLYSDGVGSIIRMATSYGASIGIDAITLLMVLLVTQFVAFPFALIYGKLADKWGTRTMIYFGIFTYCVVCVIALFMSADRSIETLTFMFWALAMLVGTAQGGIQALSRSYFGRLVPKERSNEFFGFYNIFGRFASILGTTLFGMVAIATGQQHYGIAVIAILFIAAAIIFKFVPKTVD